MSPGWSFKVWARPPDDGIERILLYDQDCAFCQRWMRWAQKHPQGRLRYEPCQQQASVRKAAGITDAMCRDSAFLVLLRDGKPFHVLSGAAAINGALERFEGKGNIGWRMLATLYHLHGFQEAQKLAYRWVARNRHKFGSQSCSVDEMRAQAARQEKAR